MKLSKTTPVEVLRGDNLVHFDSLISFLKTLELKGLL